MCPFCGLASLDIHNDRVEAMRRKPWHWPNHVSLFPLSAQNVSINVKVQNQGDGATNSRGGHSIQKSYVGHDLLDWKDFVNRPLHLIEHDDEDNKPTDKDDVAKLKTCQKGYALNTVSPCRGNSNYVPKPLHNIPKAFLRHLPFDINNPIYEHNPIDGRPFENLLQLRTEKVRNFLSLPERWELAGIGFIQYDSLLGNGLKSLTEDIGRTLGIPNDNEKNNNASTCPSVAPFEKDPYNLTDDYKDWVTKAVNWDVENLIGYHRSVP